MLQTKPSDGREACPGVDHLFESVARVAGSSTIAVLLSGMGSDGAAGMATLAACGAVTACQDEESSVVFSMPKAAIDLGAISVILHERKLADWLLRQSAAAKTGGNDPL